MKRIIYIWICLICTISYGGTRCPDVDDSKYIEYGEKFPSVVRICGSYKENPNEKYCASAVIINPHYIITAAHVVKDSRVCHILLEGKKYEITRIISYKDDESEDSDIAIGYSPEVLQLESYPALYTEEDEKDKTCSMAGFGFTGNFNDGATFSDGKRRAGTNLIDNAHKNLLFCSPSKNKDKDKTSLEFLIASGDSGGGLFIGNKLAGIHSFIFADKKPRSDYLTESAHTRISTHIAWIERNTQE